MNRREGTESKTAVMLQPSSEGGLMLTFAMPLR
jgi:hypothetical protein